MSDKFRWQAPGNGKMFDSSIQDWETNKMSQRSVGVLQFILANGNNMDVDGFESQICDYLNQKYGHEENDSTIKHFFRPLEFVGFIRKHNNILNVSIDGRNFLNNIQNGNYKEAIESYILQMLKTQYPNTATKNVELGLFPFRILLKLLTKRSLSDADIKCKLAYITKYEDIENFDLLSGAEYDKWNTWVINSLVDIGVFERDAQGNLILSGEHKDFITDIVENMNYEDMFVYDEEEIILKKNDVRKKAKRDQRIAKEVIEEAGHKCFFDEEHTTFKTKNSPNYMEGHHIIPVALGDSFEEELDCKDNLIALCPNCHKSMHLSVNENKDNLIDKIITDGTKLQDFNIEKSDLQDIYFK